MHFYLTDWETDLIRHDACPVCGGPSRQFAAKGDLRYDRCRHCGLFFLNPMPTQSSYDKLYQTTFWSDKADRMGLNRRQHIRRQFVKENLRGDRFATHLADVDGTPPPRGKILEIGCAYGGVSSTLAARFNCTPYGIEPSNAASRVAESIGVTMCGKSLAEASFPEDGFDLILFPHVLENHVRPVEALARAIQVLKPTGAIIIEAPNAFLEPHLHLYHPYAFTTHALTTLLDECGLGSIVARHGKPHGRFPGYLVAVASPNLPLGISGSLHGSRLGWWVGRVWKTCKLRRLDRLLTSSPPPDENLVTMWLEQVFSMPGLRSDASQRLGVNEHDCG